MARRIFFSFHYKPDNWRASQVRNIGAIEGNKPASDNDWEAITNSGVAAIKTWIAEQMSGRSCSIVLVGENTSGRKWITHEIQKTWDDGKGILGVFVHNLKNQAGEQSRKGSNPFWHATTNRGTRLSSVVKAYDPPYTRSSGVYQYIRDNIEEWIEEAIRIRRKYK